MRKWNRIAAWVLALTMVVSLFSGIGFQDAEAAPEAQADPTISATYPEATELLTNIGYMNNSEKAWTDAITAEEANALLGHLYASFGWSPSTFGKSELSGSTVSGNDFIANGAATLCWNGLSADMATKYFHLSRGIEGYDKTAALTREQAAQIYLNLLKGNPDYDITKIKANDSAIGLELRKTADAAQANRPVYQWFKNGEAVTAAYADTPIAVFRGGVTYNDLMRAVGIDAETSAAMQGVGGIAAGHMGYTLAHGTFAQVVNGDPINMNGTSAWMLTVCEYDDRVYTPPVADTVPANFIIEVYDSYYLQVDTVSYPGFNSRGYVLHANNVCLGALNDYEGTQKLSYYFAGGNGAYWGPWSGGDCGYNYAGLSDGYYQAIFNTSTSTLRGLKKAKVVEGTFTSLAYPNIVVGDKAYKYEGNFGLGVGLAVDDNNIGKTFVFYLDDTDYVIGMKQCSHEGTWSNWTDEGEGHVRHCTNCFLEQSGAHDIPETWTPVEGGENHQKACTVCGGAATVEKHTLSDWTPSTTDEAKCVRSCEACGYSESQDHEKGELKDFVAPEVGKPGYSGDYFCKHCGKLLEKGHETTTTCTHVPGDPVKENVVPAECEKPGGYDEVVYCTVPNCGEKLSSTHHDEDALEHIWKESGRTPAEALKDGAIHYVCERNSEHTKDEPIPAELTGKTDYEEAIEVISAAGLLNTENKVWKQNITGAEANALLQKMYDAPGFSAPWAPELPADTGVTATDFVKKMLTPLGYGSWGIDLVTMTGYLHLLKGLPADLDMSQPITREVAAQITLNALKAIPEYNADAIKANDPGLGLTLVKAGTDEMGRPSYKWQKAGQDISKVYADIPVAVLKAGTKWEPILSAVGLTKTMAGAGIHGWFQISENGGEFGAYELHYHDDPDSGVFKTADWVLEIYDSYANHSGVFAGNGVTFKLKGYQVLALSGENIPDDGGEEPGPNPGTQPEPDTSKIPSLDGISTKYPEAVQLMIALGWMDKDANWKGEITGAEANKLLDALYDGPGFVAEWSANLAADAKVTGAQFASGALVTTGWNYNNDALFTAYNHLEKGMDSDYGPRKNLTREQAAQMTLNVLRSLPTYNNETYKYQDPAFNLTLVLVKQDSMGRPYYKWQIGGVDVTNTYRDTPIIAKQAGMIWSDILSELGDVGDINIAQQFCWIEEGGDPSDFVEKKHPDYNIFLDADYAMEIYQDFQAPHNTYMYTIVYYEGTVDIPATGDSVDVVMLSTLALVAAAAVCVMLLNKKRYTA